jgi:biopolymer transport protein ExbD
MRRSILDSNVGEEEEGINLTPMLDVVFIMLIFFIVTASFVKEAGIDPERPKAETAVNKKNANILIAISANNEIWIDRKKVDKQAIRSQIERMHAENPEGSVLIQADKNSHADILMAVMAASRDAKVNVAISALAD